MNDPDAQAFIDLLNNVANMNRGANLVQLPPTPTRRDTANLTTQPKTMTTSKPNTSSLSSATLPYQQYVDEYLGNHAQLRRSGVSLADYVQCGMRDDNPSYTLSTDLRDILDSVQAKRCGDIADPLRPLDVVV